MQQSNRKGRVGRLLITVVCLLGAGTLVLYMQQWGDGEKTLGSRSQASRQVESEVSSHQEMARATDTSSATAVAMPPLQSRLELVGTLDSEDALYSSALIRDGESSSPVRYLLGDELPDGTTLHSVAARSAEILTLDGIKVLRMLATPSATQAEVVAGPGSKISSSTMGMSPDYNTDTMSHSDATPGAADVRHKVKLDPARRKELEALALED